MPIKKFSADLSLKMYPYLEAILLQVFPVTTVPIIYIEIIIWQFSYHTPYPFETPISAWGWYGYDMKIAIS